MTRITRTSLWIASTLGVVALGLTIGSNVGGANETPSQPAPPDPATELIVRDAEQTVGSLTLGELLAPPTVVDGEVRQPYYPDPGWPVHDDSGMLAGYFVPQYGFLDINEAQRFESDPSAFDPIGIPGPTGNELPPGFEPLPSDS